MVQLVILSFVILQIHHSPLLTLFFVWVMTSEKFNILEL